MPVDADGFGVTSPGGSISGPRSARARAERVLLIRSGRHLRVAVDALRERFPGCTIAVVGTPGCEGVVAQAGIPEASIFIYGAKPRFTPVAFACSRASRAARRWGFTRVAVLWNDPDGRGQGNVDRTALVLAPLGFLAITPDGAIAERSPARQLGHEAKRALVSLAAGVVLGALYVPAFAIAGIRRMLPAETGSHDIAERHDHAGSAGSPTGAPAAEPSWLPAVAGRRPAGTRDKAA